MGDDGELLCFLSFCLYMRAWPYTGRQEDEYREKQSKTGRQRQQLHRVLQDLTTSQHPSEGPEVVVGGAGSDKTQVKLSQNQDKEQYQV
jgi:hypothetical protein